MTPRRPQAATLDIASLMKTICGLLITVCLLTVACDSGSQQREAIAARERAVQTEMAALRQTSARLRADVEALRKTALNLESYASDLQSKLGHTSAETWNQDATAGRHLVGNLLIEIQSLQRGIQAVGQAR